MEYNTLTSQVRSLREHLDDLLKSDSELRLQLCWYDAFDHAASVSLAVLEEAKVEDLSVQLADIEKALENAQESVEGIRAATRLGWDPRHWFSETRSTAMSELARSHARIAKNLAGKLRCVEGRARAVTRLADVRESLERYSKFDRDEAEGRLTGLESQIARRGAELDKWEAREKALDKELEVPMAKFLDLRSQLGVLEHDLVTANRLERQLGQASNGFERKQIHDECVVRFGIGRPQEVIRKTERAINSPKRNIDKLDYRLREIGRRWALDVRTLVIDGSNLCYQADRLIGLSALRALCARLNNDFQVTVVFDASIRRKLNLSDEMLRSQLPGTTVYVVASKMGADETILDAAEGPTTFVLSNDLFSDFPEKLAVREARLIGHEIINGRVLVPDLGINLEFGT